jgi:hypothetical protein
MPYKDPEKAKANRAAYQATHKKEIAARNRTYRAAHRNERAEYDKNYTDTHKTEIAAYKKEYYTKNKIRIAADKKNYYTTHKKQLLAQQQVYYTTHKTERYLKARSYIASHLEETKEYYKRYYVEHVDEITKYKKEYQKRDANDGICIQCGKKFLISKYTTGKFCSDRCAHKWYSGPNNANWRGGISIEYCPKFNEQLREEIRTKFGRLCFLSGIKENGNRLDVHHCDYLKSQGCQGQRWSLLPLNHGWHTKTNTNRWYWFALLRDYWLYKYIENHGMDTFEGPDRTTWLWEMYNNG